ncbi:hypothetical protein AVEN_136975-1 [Araneus ventricosus]|uniref:Uncharacterized protein n=1 Tax=Araneus ventricosus TaxID=182803 RepID=A0A4Y2BGY4_ARAVE|nr:hypothetical protein AVEN_136975-1 [Araneus ventricosus]
MGPHFLEILHFSSNPKAYSSKSTEKLIFLALTVLLFLHFEIIEPLTIRRVVQDARGTLYDCIPQEIDVLEQPVEKKTFNSLKVLRKIGTGVLTDMFVRQFEAVWGGD